MASHLISEQTLRSLSHYLAYSLRRFMLFLFLENVSFMMLLSDLCSMLMLLLMNAVLCNEIYALFVVSILLMKWKCEFIYENAEISFCKQCCDFILNFMIILSWQLMKIYTFCQFTIKFILLKFMSIFLDV